MGGLENGQSDRTNQTVEIMQRHWCAEHPGCDLDEPLPAYQAIPNASVNAATGYTPQRLLYGFEARLP